MSRQGKVFSYTRIFIDTPVVDEFPYLVAYVLLDDGITVPARLKHFEGSPDVGTPVELEVGVTGRTAAGEEIEGYYFRPEKGGDGSWQEK